MRYRENSIGQNRAKNIMNPSFTSLQANFKQKYNRSHDHSNTEKHQWDHNMVHCQRLQLAWFFPLHSCIPCFLICFVVESSLNTSSCFDLKPRFVIKLLIKTRHIFYSTFHVSELFLHRVILLVSIGHPF